MQAYGTKGVLGRATVSCSGRTPLVVQARFGGGGLILGPGGNDPNRFASGGKQASRPGLIIPGQLGGRPGQQPGGGSPQKIVFPTPNKDKPAGGVLDLPDDSDLGMVTGVGATGTVANGPPTVNKYRPPAGFMNDALPEDATASMEPQEMLSKLRARAGRWYDLAVLVPSLNAKGYDSTAIDEITGITPAQQNKWVVAATVYYSVKGAVSPKVLAHFDANGEDLLHPFRFLGADRRIAAAEYIVEQQLEAPLCEVLARAMKEFERRPTERHGFSEHPADCLAFKYLRDALECRRREDLEEKLLLGLEVAVTQGARERLEAILHEGSEGSASASSISATLTTLRLNPEELGVRPVVVLGELGGVAEAEMEAAPKTSQSGAFGIFAIDTSSMAEWKWVALPQWRLLAMARHPVAVTVADCSAVTAIVVGSKAKTDEDLKRLQGSGIIVADKDPSCYEELVQEGWYLAIMDGSRAVQLVDGRRAALLQQGRGRVLASVLLLARPPHKETPNLGTDLLQL